MKSKKPIKFPKTKVIILVLILIILLLAIFRLSGEDSWIKNFEGIWIKHGVPSDTPTEVERQQLIIQQVRLLYQKEREKGTIFKSQCLGTISNYAIDIVNNPRMPEDNLPQNQCDDYQAGRVQHFIEIDKYGRIVKIR